VVKKQFPPGTPPISFFVFLRAFAILWVFSYHAYNNCFTRNAANAALQQGVLKYLLSNISSPADYIFLPFRILFSFGSLGVELFIIASGFGLYYSYLTKKRESWCSFYRKRALRILPLYYLTLIGLVLGNIFIFKAAYYSSYEGLKVLGYHFLLLQTFSDAYLPFPFLYFIAVIFQLYLAFPLLLRVMKSTPWGALLFFISFAVSPFIKQVFEFTGLGFRGILFTDYLPFFLLGMLIAESFYRGGKMQKILFDKRAALASFTSLFVVIYLISYHMDYGFGARWLIALLFFFSIPLLFDVFNTPEAKKTVDLIAYSSYSLYLVHMFVLKISQKLFFPGDFGRFFSISAASVLLLTSVFLSYYLQKGYDSLSKQLFLAKPVQ